MFERLLELITKEQLKKLEETKILLVGIGGVGGYVLEALIRSGFKKISIVDGDIITPSNLNRQILATKENIGHLKTEEAKKRMELINPEISLTLISRKLTKENFSQNINESYDFIIDACDDIPIKIQLIKFAQEKGIFIISSLGTGRKLDATKLEITKLNKTFNDPLAKKLRQELKKENLPLNIPVIFSKEMAIPTNKKVGSAIFVPATAGILIANYVFNKIIEKD